MSLYVLTFSAACAENNSRIHSACSEDGTVSRHVEEDEGSDDEEGGVCGVECGDDNDRAVVNGCMYRAQWSCASHRAAAGSLFIIIKEKKGSFKNQYSSGILLNCHLRDRGHLTPDL